MAISTLQELTCLLIAHSDDYFIKFIWIKGNYRFSTEYHHKTLLETNLEKIKDVWHVHFEPKV